MIVIVETVALKSNIKDPVRFVALLIILLSVRGEFVALKNNNKYQLNVVVLKITQKLDEICCF